MNRKDGQHFDLSQRLFIELGTPLLIETSEETHAFAGKLVGMKVGSYLIVDISRVKSDTITIVQEDSVLVKYVNLEDIFNFSSIVLKVLDQPDDLIFLQYPVMVESCNIRSHRRVDCFLPITAGIGNCRVPGVITNISPRGCLCTLDYSQIWENSNGQKIDLLLSYGDMETLAIAGDIRSTQTQDSQMKLGIKFDEMNSFSKSVLATLIPALKI